jgi:hypothetical protein
MPLNKAGLKAGLQAVAENPPGTIAGCAQKWAEAVGTFFAAIVPASVAVSAAQTALQAALTSAFAAPDPASVALQMDAAFLACATTIGGGMAPAFTVAVPPVLPVGFAHLFAPPFPQTHAEAAEKIANAIHVWALTGTAAAPPAAAITWT